MISVWGLTDQGVVRRNNQDGCASRLLGPDRAWGVVCDGMGGANAGDVASRLAIETFRKVLEEALAGELPAGHEGELLIRAAAAANEAVYDRAAGDPDCEGMGTTLVGALLWDRVLWTVNVGDSRGYLFRDGALRRITRDHSVVEDLVEQGKVTPEQARFHPQKNLITRALGTEPLVRADLFRDPLLPGDAVLLCSDGLVNVLADRDVAGELQAGGTPEAICHRLLERTLEGGAPDNVTVVLFQL